MELLGVIKNSVQTTAKVYLTFKELRESEVV